MFYLKSIKGNIPNDEECKELNVDPDVEYEKANRKYGDDSDRTYCWCKRQDLDSLLTDNDINDLWGDFITDKAWDGGLTLATAFGIIVLNFIIKVALGVITVSERSPNVTKEKLKIMTRAFVAIFINTALITLIVNAKIDEDLY